MSQTPPSTVQLVSVLRNQPADRPEQLRGALEGVLTPGLGASAAKSTASIIVDDSAYDCPAAMAEITPNGLRDIGIPVGRHTRICVALFGPDFGSAPASAMGSPSPFHAGPGMGGPPPFVMPTPVVNVTTAERVNRATKAAWPAPASAATPSPEAYLDFGLSLRTHFRESVQVSDALGAAVGYTPDQWADAVFDRFSAPWTDIPAGHVPAGAHDKQLCSVLLKAPPGNIPPWAANLVRQQLSEDRGLEALLVLGRQIFTTTDLSDRMVKDAVRTPHPATSVAHVPRRLAQWDADYATVRARGFVVDDPDRRAGLLMLVGDIKVFKPTLAAMEAKGTFTSVELRAALGVVADRARSGVVAQKSAHAVGRVGAKPGKGYKAVKDLAAKVATGGAQIPLCHAFRDHGTCRRGAACKYSHDPKAVDNRKDFLAACALFYDEGHGTSMRGVIWAVGLQALRMGRMLDPLMTIINAFTDVLTQGAPLVCDAAAAATASKSDTLAGGEKSAFAHSNPFAALAGPLADSGADCCFIGAAHEQLCVDHQPARVCSVQTGNGVVKLDAVATLPGAAGFMQHSYLLSGSLESLVSVGEICESTGCGYTQDPGNSAARFWHPDSPGGDVELLRDGRLFRVPIDFPAVPWACSSTSGTKVTAAACPVTRSKGKKPPVALAAPVAAPVAPPPKPQALLDPDAAPFVLSTGDAGFDKLPAPLEPDVPPPAAPPAADAAVPLDMQAWYRVHRVRGHPFDARCDCCVRGRLRDRSAKRVDPAERAAGDGYVMSADFTGIHEADLDGHRVALVATVHSYGLQDSEPEAAYGFVALLTNRKTATVAAALDDFDVELARLGSSKERSIVRFHTDVDKSFLGKVKRLAVRKGWVQTDTGGYRSRANGIVERRIGMLKQTARTLLLSASGGDCFYVQLWGHAMLQANFCCNVNDWSSRASPFQQLTGDAYEWGPEDHAFGELVTFLVPEECRDDTYRPPGEQGIWVRRDRQNAGPGSSRSGVIVPIKWDFCTRAWVLLPTVVSNSFKVHSGVFPLRMRPPPGSSSRNFDDFVDAAFEPLLASVGVGLLPAVPLVPSAEPAVPVDADGGESDLPLLIEESDTDDDADSDSDASDDGWEVEAVLNRKDVAGVTMYLIKWAGYSRKHNNWVPAADLDAPKLVAEYEHGLSQRQLHYAAAFVVAALEGSEAVCAPEFSHSEEAAELGGGDVVLQAVTDLHRKQKMTGAPEDFVEPYLLEYASVKGRRLRELTPEQAKKVRAECLAPRLRMLLAVKRDGRCKCRLILQGFSEPEAWDEGRSVDSPVAYYTTVRMLLTKSGRKDVISKRDVSVAFLQSSAYTEDDPLRYCRWKQSKDAPEKYYQLLGPLYGQRSAGRCWFETLSTWLIQDGFVQGKNDPCLFTNTSTGLVVVVYVDDIITRGEPEVTAAFHERFGDRFMCTDVEYLAPDHELDFLAFTIRQEVSDGGLFIYMDQREAVESLLADFDLATVPLKSSPMPSKELFHSDSSLLTANAAAVYKHVIGSLNYFVRCTRYDIGYPVSRLSSKMGAPDRGAWKSMLHLLGYLRATLDFRIGCVYGASSDEFQFFVDSDHCSDCAYTTRSQSGILIFLNGCPVEWASRRQPVTAVSPAEAEVYAMREGVVAGRLVQWVAEEMAIQVAWPFLIKSDSTQAVSFQKATAPNSKLRRVFDMRKASVQELRDQGIVKSKHILRDLNVSDLLTHCLSGPSFLLCLGRAQNLQSDSHKGAFVNYQLS
jgi:hypothetical protein